MNLGIGGLLLLATEPCVDMELSESLEWVESVGLGAGERGGGGSDCCCCCAVLKLGCCCAVL